MTPESITQNFATIETEANNLNSRPLYQAEVGAQMLQVHAVLSLGSAILLVAEEIRHLRESLGEQ